MQLMLSQLPRAGLLSMWGLVLCLSWQGWGQRLALGGHTGLTNLSRRWAATCSQEKRVCVHQWLHVWAKLGTLPHLRAGFLFFFLFFFFLFRAAPWPMEGPRLGVQLELQPPAYTTAIATQDPSRVCDLHHSSPPRWILNPLSEARDQTCNLFISDAPQCELHLLSYVIFSFKIEGLGPFNL